MKKYIVAVILIAVLAMTALSGCNNKVVPTNQYAKYERYEYDAFTYTDNGESKIGTMVMSVSISLGETVNWGADVPSAYCLESFNGFKVKYTLTLDNGDSIDSVAYFRNNSTFQPAVAHKVVSINSGSVVRNESIYSRFDYSKRNVMYYYNVNGIEQDAIKCGRSTCVDNESVYMFLRTYPMTSSVSLSVKVPDTTSGTARNISISKGSNTKVKSSYSGKQLEYDAYCMTISLNDKMNGISYYAYYSVDNIDYNDASLIEVPLVIREGSTEYRLKSIQAAKA